LIHGSDLAALAVLFAAACVHGTLGFAFALVAMPLLALGVGIQTATPLVAFAGLTTTSLILWGSWRSVDLRAARSLVLASVVGIPVGLVLLRAAPEAWVEAVLGLVLVGFGFYNLSRPRLVALEREGWAWLFGFLAGVLGGAYNTPGPPAVLYGAMRRWEPERFRATLQGLFLPTAVLVWLGHGVSGLWSWRVVRLYALSVPLLVLGIALGRRLAQRIPAARFDRVLYAILVALGVLMLR
jgi:uncharacterized membrane protein YfcA